MSADFEDRHIVLLGLMSAGKTEIGRRLVDRLDRELLDGDDELERREGRTAREIADVDGIDALHRLEAIVALDALRSTTPAIVGPAASVIESAEVRDALRDHIVVWLTAPPEHLAEGVAEGTHRPLVHEQDPLQLIEEQLERRQPLAVDIATMVIDVSTAPKDDLADLVVEAVRGGVRPRR